METPQAKTPTKNCPNFSIVYLRLAIFFVKKVSFGTCTLVFMRRAQLTLKVSTDT